MKGWLKKLAGDFTGAADKAPAAPIPPAPPPVTPTVSPKVVAPAPQQPVAFSATSVQEFEKAREDFFAALKSDDAATIERIAADYPGEAMGWRTKEGTPLNIAQVSGSLQSFKALLALGADKEEKYPNGSFPLHYAQVNNQKDFFNLLLDGGANIERTVSVNTYQHGISETMTHTALGTAIKQGNKEDAIALMERGADTKAPYTYQRENLSLMIHGGTTPAPKPKSAVDYATAEGHFLIADIAKRAHVLRDDFLTRQATPPAPAVADPAETAAEIGVMQPLKLKKQPDLKS